MKTALSVAMICAVMAGPALAAGMQNQQSGQILDQPYHAQSQQSQQSAKQSALMDNQTIIDAQQKLKQQGYNVAIDGKLGPSTRQALRQFQHDQGIQGSGHLDQQTMAALGVESNVQQAQTPSEPKTGGHMQQQNPSGSQDNQQ
jgi:peptidoglycan hydrolase-like protein with peptidoglycan-binding domain